VNAGRFRADLYYRLAVVTLRLPPLRDRTEDIPLLVDAMLQALGAGDKEALFTDEVHAELAAYHWPGNVRELRNYVERRVVADMVGVPSFPLESPPQSESRPSAAPSAAVDIDVPFKEAKDAIVSGFEEAYLRALFTWARGNVSKAARKAKIDRMHVHRLIQRHGIERPPEDAPDSTARDRDE
jgi:DNA-binding NtrC family response regulator